MRQKSRIKWLKEGYCNSSIFHKSVKVKQFSDQIEVLCTLDGKHLTSQEEISAEAVSFFKNLLGTAMPTSSLLSIGEVKRLSSNHTVHQGEAMLQCLVLASDITTAIKNFPSNKAPGPDGYTTGFFKAS